MNRHLKLFPVFLLMLSVIGGTALADETRIHLQLDEENVRLTDYGVYVNEAKLKEMITEKGHDQGLALSDLQIRKTVMALDKTAKRYKPSTMTSFALTYEGILYCVRWKEEAETEQCQ